jgi:hypothetical protein
LATSPIDDYSDLQLSEKAKNQLLKTILNLKAGLITAVALICKGPTECVFSERCPIFIADGVNGAYPVGRQCLLESNYAREKFLGYIDELGMNEAEVENSPTKRSMLSKLVELDIYDFRSSLILAGAFPDTDGSLLFSQTIAINQEGENIDQIQSHPCWNIKIQIHKQRSELLDALLLTPKRDVWRRAALKQKQDDNYLTIGRKLQEKLDLVLDSLNEENED